MVRECFLLIRYDDVYYADRITISLVLTTVLQQSPDETVRANHELPELNRLL
jgi:hypothetical protein